MVLKERGARREGRKERKKKKNLVNGSDFKVKTQVNYINRIND